MRTYVSNLAARLKSWYASQQASDGMRTSQFPGCHGGQSFSASPSCSSSVCYCENDVPGTALQNRDVVSVKLYERMLVVLASRGLNKKPGATPLEFSARICLNTRRQRATRPGTDRTVLSCPILDMNRSPHMTFSKPRDCLRGLLVSRDEFSIRSVRSPRGKTEERKRIKYLTDGIQPKHRNLITVRRSLIASGESLHTHTFRQKHGQFGNGFYRK